MSEDNVGGAAFPTPNDPLYLGMSLRDYFAATALQGLLSRGGHDKINVHDVLAQRAYQIADAMLEAREE